jgi:hypothetical protein
VTTDLNLSARSAPLALMLRFTTRFDVSYDTLPERSVLLAVPSLQPQTRCLSRDPARLFHACALPNLASLGLSHFAFQTFTGVHASRLRAPHFFLLPPATLTHQLPTRFHPSRSHASSFHSLLSAALSCSGLRPGLAALQPASIASTVAPQLFSRRAFTLLPPCRLAPASSPLPDLPTRTRAVRSTGPHDYLSVANLAADVTSIKVLHPMSFRGLSESRDPYHPTAVLPYSQRPILS